MSPRPTILIVLSLLAALAALPACKSKSNYARPLAPGESALRKLDEADWPDLSRVASMDDAFLRAVKRSLDWFDRPSTKQFYPLGGITHDQARATLYALPHIAWEAGSPEAFLAKLKQECDMYTSVGWDGEGTVLFTAYYTPIFAASRVRTGEFQYPLYRRPADLVADAVTGQVFGRKVGDQIVPYPPRIELEATNLLSGRELVYLRSRLDAYIVEVQGSAQLRMTDGATMRIGFAGANGHEYTSIRQLLIEDGKVDPDTANLTTIREYFQQNPRDLDRYIRRNDRFIFFTDYSGQEWPAGSLGVKVESMRSLATDKSVFPRGCVTLVDTMLGDAGGPAFKQWMLDQDTGGAIRAAGRADIYFGIGSGAESRAGRQIAEGRLYYLFLKPQRVEHWLGRMGGAAPATAGVSP